MKYKSILAVAIVAAFLIAVVPMVSDGSDAASMTDGSAGAGYKIKDLSGDDLAKIFPADWQMDMAKGVLDVIIRDDVDNYNFSTPVVTEYCASEYQGKKIDGNAVTVISSHEMTYKIEFTATRGNAPQATLLDNAEKNKELLREIGISNLSQEGAVFTVTAKVENIGSDLSQKTYETNSLGLVLTKTYERESVKWVTDADVSYKYNDGTSDKTIQFTSSNGHTASSKVTTTYDFLGVAIADVTLDTRAILNYDYNEFGINQWDTVEFNKNTLGTDTFLIDPQQSPGYVSVAYGYANIDDVDKTVGNYYLYGESGSGVCIFDQYSDIDPSLKSSEAMKAFITDHSGSYSDGEYDPAKSACDSAYKDVSVMDELKLALIVLAVVIGAFALLFLILIIVVIVLIVKRKKR